MRKIIIVIFINFSSSGFSCEYNDILSHLKDLKHITDIAQPNCIDKKTLIDSSFIGEIDRDGICECADSVTLRPKNEVEFDKKRKRPFVEKAIDKAKLGLYNISKEILNLAVMASNGSEAFAPSPECDLTKRLETEGDLSVFQCSGNENETILTTEQRKTFARELSSTFKNELLDSYNNSKTNNGLVDRSNQSNQNSCDLSEKDFIEIKQSMVPIQFSVIAGALKLNPELAVKSIGESYYQAGDNLSEHKTRFFDKAEKLGRYNPVLERLLNDPIYLNEIMNKNNGATKIYQTALNNGSIKNKIQKDLNLKCDIAFENIKKSLCLKVSDSVIPENTEKTLGIFKEIENRSSGTKLQKQVITSSILRNNYCGSGQDEPVDCKKLLDDSSLPQSVDCLEESINGNLPVNLVDLLNPNDAYSTDFEKEVKKESDKMCEFLPSNLTRKQLGERLAKECKTDTDDIFKQDCIKMNAIRVFLDKKVNDHLIKVDSIALTRAKKEAKTNGVDPKDPSIVKRATEIAKTLKDKVDVDGILSAIKDSKEVDELNTDAGAKLIADFIGGKSQETYEAKEEKVLAQQSSGGSNQSGERTIQGPSGSDSESSTTASIGVNPRFGIEGQTANSKVEKPKNIYQKSGLAGKAAPSNSLDPFYKEFERRLSAKQPEWVQQKNARVGEDRNKPFIPKELADASGYEYSDSSSYDQEEPSYIDNRVQNNNFASNNSGNNFNQDSSGNNVASTKNSGAQSYNDALGDAQKGNDIKKSPFKGVGVGKKTGKSSAGRGVASASSRSGGASKGTGFLNSGDEGSSATKEPFALDPDTFVGDLESLIENVLEEQKQGVEGENTIDAQYILDMFGDLLDTDKTKRLVLVSTKDKKINTDLVKDGRGKISLNSVAESKQMTFHQKVRDSILNRNGTKLSPKFESLISQLKSVLESGVKIAKRQAAPTRYGDFR